MVSVSFVGLAAEHSRFLGFSGSDNLVELFVFSTVSRLHCICELPLDILGRPPDATIFISKTPGSFLELGVETRGRRCSILSCYRCRSWPRACDLESSLIPLY